MKRKKWRRWRKLLAICIALSLTVGAMSTVSVQAVYAEKTEAKSLQSNEKAEAGATKNPETKPGAWKTGAINFSISKVYSTGLAACGAGLLRIADATGNEEFQKVASFLNKWIFGANTTGQSLAEIKALCNEILEELDQINEKMDEYSAKIEEELLGIKYQNAKTAMEDRWDKDVANVEAQNNIGNTKQAYVEYMRAARNYVNGTGSMEEVNSKKENLEINYRNIYEETVQGFDANVTPEEKKDIIFTNSTIDTQLAGAIRTMANNLNKDSNYMNAVGQFTYESQAFSADQYEYIITCVERQFLEIITLEMVYEEFMAQRGEYFEEKYSENEQYWESYERWKKNLSDLNEEVAEKMGNMLDREVTLNSDASGEIKLKLTEFMKPEDATSVNLENTDFKEIFDTYEEEEPVKNYVNSSKADSSVTKILNDASSESEVTSSYMKYHRIAVPVSKSQNASGVEVYYIFDTAQSDDEGWIGTNSIPENLKFYHFNYKMDINAAGDIHLPSADFMNLAKSNYFDGVNTINSVKTPENLKALFKTDLFTALSSTPVTYLKNFLITTSEQASANKKTYIVLPDYQWNKETLPTSTSYTTFHVIDTSAQYPDSELKVSNLSAEDIQSGHAERDNYAYTTIMQSTDNYQTEIKTTRKGSGIASFYAIIDNPAGGELVQDKSTIAAGETFKLRIQDQPNADQNPCVIEKIDLLRYNDASNPDQPTSTETILTRDQYESLEKDNQGYRYLEYAAPYSKSEFVLYTSEGYNVSVENETPEFEGTITLDAYNNVFAEGDNVSFYLSDNIQKIGYGEGSDYKEIQIKEDEDGNRMGSFTMPGHDVILYYEADCDHTYDNGICSKCGAYQPAHYNQETTNYEIGNAGQMLWFAGLINGNFEHTNITEKKNDANGLLVADISLEDREWKPMEEFRGIFDGQGHKISGFKISSVDGDEGFFNHVVEGNVRDFTLCGKIGEKDPDEKYTNKYTVGGVIATLSGGLVEKVHSDVDIVCGKITNLGGVVGYSTKPATIQETAYYGEMRVNSVANGSGGIVGYIEYPEGEYNGEASTIKNCANYGTVTRYVMQSTGSSGSSAGGLIGTVSVQNQEFVLTDSFSCGSFSGVGATYGLLFSLNPSGNNKIENCYYLDTSALSSGLGEDSKGIVEKKTEKQFADGEVAYLVNRGVTDGSQVWYQNIDNGKEPDIYPLLDDTHGTVYKIGEDEYSNTDKVNTYEIRTFEELKQAIETVKKEPKANFKLMNNINANGETLTETIGSDANPYLGTFDGQGFYIYKFNVDCAESDAAMFGAIGKDGVVQKLGIFYDTTSGNRAAGIAGINAGTINECISGSNVGGTFNDNDTDKRHSLSVINTFVTGKEMAGGIVIENSGVIRNTASYTKVNATNADAVSGGIAAINTGVIENSFARGNITAGAEKKEENARAIASIAGGITGINEESGKIRVVYCTATTITGDIKGAIYGRNDNGTFTDTFYLDELRNGTDQGTAMTSQEMKKTVLPDKLNELAAKDDNLNSWYVDDDKNSGYPVIESSMFERKTLKNEKRGITVTGKMHINTKLHVNTLDSKDIMYQAFEKYASEKGMKLQFAGTPVLQYENGDAADYEGSLTLEVDASKYEGKNYIVLIYRDGKVEETAVDSKQLSTLEVKELPTFAVASGEDTKTEKEQSQTTQEKGNTTDKNSKTSSVKASKTGDTNTLLVWVILLLAATGAGGSMIYRRKRRK